MVNILFTITNISIFVIIIIFCLLLLSSSDIILIKKVVPFLNFFKNNHSSKLVHSIIAVNPNEDCPNNSSPFQFYTYPGTSKGCIISGNKLEKDSCNFIIKLFKKTEEIEETKEKSFNTIFTRKLCAVSFDEKNYSSNLNNNNENDKNKKYCGLLDTIKTKYYLDNDKECPINKIIINKEKNINDGKYIFNSIELKKDEYYLHYSNNYNENNNYLLTNNSLFVSEGYPCINPEEINTFHIQYKLSKANNNYICNTNIENIRLDTRYFPIINVQKNELYKDNDIILDNSNFFNYPFQDSDLTLYQIGYIGTNSKFNDEIIPIISELISDINSIYDLNKINQFIKRIIYSFIFIIIISLILKYFISDKTIFIWNSILLSIIIIHLIINIIINILIKKLKKLKNIHSANNEIIFNLQMKYINSLINNSISKNIKVIIGDILIGICVGMFNILNYFYFNNPKNNILKFKNKTDYCQNKKFYNSINALKPTSFDIKKENLIKIKEEIELPRINSKKNEENNIIDDSNDEEENNLTSAKNDNYNS